MRYQANFLYLNLIYAVTLICFSYLFYFKIKNIFLTNFIVIAAAILLFTKLIYWYSSKSLQKFKKDTDRKNIFLLRLAFCIFAYITPVYYIFQENSLVVSHYISAITLAIITIFALSFNKLFCFTGPPRYISLNKSSR